MTSGVKCSGNLSTAKASIGQESAVFSCKRNPLGNTMVDNTIAHLGKAPRYFDRIHGLKAILELDGDGCKAEFVANLIKGATVVAKATDKDVYAAIDAASDKLETQLRRYNDKLKEHRVKVETAEPEGEAEETEEEMV